MIIPNVARNLYLSEAESQISLEVVQVQEHMQAGQLDILNGTVGILTGKMEDLLVGR